VGPPPGLYAELGRWKAKAIKRGKPCTFTSDVIPDWLGANVQAAMDVVGVEDAFSFLKQREDLRERIERRLQNKLAVILRQYERLVAEAIARGEQPDYDALFEALRAAVGPDSAAITTDEAMRLAADVGIVFDPAVINVDAVRWARDYSYELVRGITDTTRTLVSEATATFVETPGMTIGDLERLLKPAFGSVRAEMIAVTETTRAFSAATTETQALLNQTGVQMIRIWNTRNDEVVCPICGPLNGLPESEWRGMFGDGPPAHVNCRCGLALTDEDDEGVIPDAIERAETRLSMLEELGKQKEAEAQRERIAQLRERI